MPTSIPQQILHHLAGVLLPIVGGFLIYWLMQRALLVLIHGTSLTLLALRPATVIVRYTVIAGVAFMVLAHFEIPVEGLWTILTTAAATIAIGFVALWSVLSNLLCTFLLIAFKPFGVGDQIELPPDGIKGEVKDLTLFFTVLIDEEGYLIQIPNSLFFQRIIKRRRAGDKLSARAKANESNN